MKRNLNLSANNFNLSKISVSVVVASLAVLADQISKALIFSFGQVNTSCNFGFAFGLLPNVFVVFVSASVLVVLGLLVVLTKDLLRAVAISLLIGGGLANIIDRLYRHCVVDFIDLGFWPSFNFADVFVFIGACLVVYSYLFKKPMQNGS